MTKDTPMFRSNLANQLAAAAFSVILSASFLAYAIVPASPGLA
ncbi:enoyl-CoA hydratase [Erythrobacter sp.]|nr:enoyl-CoA hydratase [Erythrobacter sp.]